MKDVRHRETDAEIRKALPASRLEYSEGARALSVLFYVLERPPISIAIYQGRGEKHENSHSLHWLRLWL